MYSSPSYPSPTKALEPIVNTTAPVLGLPLKGVVLLQFPSTSSSSVSGSSEQNVRANETKIINRILLLFIVSLFVNGYVVNDQSRIVLIARTRKIDAVCR